MEDTIELSELIRILWKRKWVWILIPILAAIAAFAASKWMTPTYEASTTIVIGNFNDNVYTNLQASKEVILSHELLAPIKEELALTYPSTKAFEDNISVELIQDAGMIKITAKYHDPEKAQQIAAAIAEAYLAKSNQVYQEKRQLVERLLKTLQQRYEQTAQSLDRNKQALTAIETNNELSNAEKDIVRARLLDYVVKDENTLVELTSQIQGVQNQLLEMDDAQLVEAAQVPETPVSPRPLLNTAIAFVVGGMVGVGLALMMEYFQHHPIRLEEADVPKGK